MEKLIELLNEYEKLNMCRKFDSFEMNTFENSSGVDRLLEDTVISARYGFIQWLVDNDKVDLGDIALKVYNLDLSVRKHTYTEYPIYESLLMILSIQDNPIEWLCEILR